MVIAQLLASPFLGGPEKQVLGLSSQLPAGDRTLLASFAEGGKARPFLEAARQAGFEAVELRENWPHARRAAQEIADLLCERNVDLLCTNGYKPDLIGLLAARRADVPAVAIAHGWTGATWKVRLNERLDKLALRWFPAVVGVSEAQSQRLLAAGVSPARVTTIPNAVAVAPLMPRDAGRRAELESLFTSRPECIVAAAGRLSPEKGFSVLIQAAARVAATDPAVGFVIFGEGPLRSSLEQAVRDHGLEGRVVLAGFRHDVVDLLPCLDAVVMPSFTEGLPVFLLEAMAAARPVAASRVGGIPEPVEHEVTGLLVEPGDAAQLAQQISRLASDAALRERLGDAARRRAAERYSVEEQAARYRALFERIVAAHRP